MKITSGGDVEITNGIKLGGTAAANLLDDYEEGTWTPSFSQQGATTGSGTYTKVGRLVTVRATITCDTNGSASGALFMGGLPFAATSNTLRLILSIQNVNASAGGNGVAAPFNGQMFYMHDQYVRATSTSGNPYYSYNLLQIGTIIQLTGTFETTA